MTTTYDPRDRKRGWRVLDGGRSPARTGPKSVELTFRVPLEFRTALKYWAMQERLTMTQLIRRELRPPSLEILRAAALTGSAAPRPERPCTTPGDPGPSESDDV
jgi:hypothetical protein